MRCDSIPSGNSSNSNKYLAIITSKSITKCSFDFELYIKDNEKKHREIVLYERHGKKVYNEERNL